MNNLIRERLKSELSKDKRVLTKPREIIFSLLVDKSPISLKDLNQKTESKVDRATVYRTIDLFEKLGIVHRIYMGWKYKIELTDLFTAHHHHLSCLRCEAVIDIKDEKHLDEFITKVSKAQGFRPKSHQLEVFGLCANCSSIT